MNFWHMIFSSERRTEVPMQPTWDPTSKLPAGLPRRNLGRDQPSKRKTGQAQGNGRPECTELRSDPVDPVGDTEKHSVYHGGLAEWPANHASVDLQWPKSKSKEKAT